MFALPASGQTYGTELVVNGGGEAGPASANGMTIVPASRIGPLSEVSPWWPTVLWAFPPQARGARAAKFFAGGPDSLFSTASQDINLQALAGDIDTGGVGYDLVRGWAAMETRTILHR